MTFSPAGSYLDLLIGGFCVPVYFALRLNESLFKLIVIWMQGHKIFITIPNLRGIERRVEEVDSRNYKLYRLIRV